MEFYILFYGILVYNSDWNRFSSIIYGIYSQGFIWLLVSYW